MESPSTQAVPNPEDVLQHLDWVRSLAAKLVRDPGEADDLRQEVWLLSQRLSRPRRIPLKGWLSGLLRNVARERRRASTTRTLHEESQGLSRALAADTPPRVRDVHAHQIVLERLTDLREPYRSTLIACYFENLSHAEIAERDGVTLHAIRSRVQRGLSELRQDMAQLKAGGTSALALLALTVWDPAAYAGGAAAAAAATPSSSVAGQASSPATALATALATAPASAPASLPTSGAASASGAAVPIALVVLSSGGIGAAIWALSGSSPSDEPPVDLAGRVATTEPAATIAAPPIDRQREAAASRASGIESPSIPEPATPSTSIATSTRVVRVIDLEDRPVAGITLRYGRVTAPQEMVVGPVTTTDNDGFATVSGISGSGLIVCDNVAYHQVALPSVGDTMRTGDVPTAVVGRRTDVAGRVTSADGEPLQGAEVRFDFARSLPGLAGEVVERSTQQEEIDRTAQDGTFAIDLAVSATPMRLTVRKPGYLPHVQASIAIDGERRSFEVVLDRPTDPRWCYGRVVAPSGDPVAGAWVADGIRAVRTDSDGRFDLGVVPEGALLFAGAPGFLASGNRAPDQLKDLEIELSGRPLRIEGRATYPDGAAGAGLLVRIPSAAYAGEFQFYHTGRSARMPVTLESFGRPIDGYRPSTVAATTDATGAFVIEGLRNQDYALEFTDPVTLQRVQPPFIPAGANGVEVELPARHAALSGTVRSSDGALLKDALVRTYYDASVQSKGPQTRTDSSGSFQFDGLVPGTLVHVSTKLPWVHVGVHVAEDRSLQIEVEPAALVRVVVDRRQRTLANERQPTSAAFLDSRGEVVPAVVDDVLGYLVDGFRLPRGTAGIAKSQRLLVPIRARALVLSDEDGAIVTLPLSLEAGDELQIDE